MASGAATFAVTIRTKVWLLVAVSAAVTAGLTFWARIYAMRTALLQESRAAAEQVADDVKRALERFEADAADQELALALTSYMLGRHSRILRLQLLVERETSSPSLIDAPRGQRTEITRLQPAYRQAEHEYYSRQDTGENALRLTRTVDLQGPWTATLTMHWSTGAVDSMLRTTERWSIALGAVHLAVLVLLVGFIIDRVVLRRLETLAAAMRDVERGDLDRRVPAESDDEVGRLSQGFNRMLEQLSSADQEIRAFSERLAEEIEAATQDLSKKNVALAQLNRLLTDSRRENASKVRLATLGQLAAQLAHEIGTPLSSVSGHLQLALLQKDVPPGLRERLEVASREIARIGRIVRDYLDSTRSLEPDKMRTSLGQVVREAVEVARGVEPAGRAAVEVGIADEPADFVTDPGLLRQVVVNLLSNALDAIERDGKVTVSARSDGDDVLVTVGDTGPGIPPEDLRRIFEPFYTTKGRGKGTGLGLAICRELVAALGGSISVESTPGQGSTFTVRLPRRGAPARADGGRLDRAAGGAA